MQASEVRDQISALMDSLGYSFESPDTFSDPNALKYHVEGDWDAHKNDGGRVILFGEPGSIKKSVRDALTSLLQKLGFNSTFDIQDDAEGDWFAVNYAGELGHGR